MSSEPPKQIPLSMESGGQSQNTGQQNTGQQNAGYQANGQAPLQAEKPVMGWIAVGCGILGILSWGIIFVPMGIVCSIIALLMGQGTWAFFGIVLAVIGFITSPTLWSIVGLGALAAYFGIPI